MNASTCIVNTAQAWERVASVPCADRAVGRIMRPHSPQNGGMPVCVKHSTGWGSSERFVAFDFFAETLRRNS